MAFAVAENADVLEDGSLDDDHIREFGSPYKLCVFLLLSEIEKAQQTGDGFDVNEHAFLGILLSFLIRQRHLSIFSLKYFVVRFIEPLAPHLVESFFKSLRTQSQIGFMLNADSLFVQKQNTNFAWPKSIIGMFARKVQSVSDKRELLGRNDVNNYLALAITNEELEMLRDKWRFDMETTSRRISEIEEKFLDVVC